MTDTHLGMYTEEEYLKHFGKKGMKWGVRNDSKSKSDVRATKLPLTPAQQAARRKKMIIIGSVAVAAVLAAGVTYAVVTNHKINVDLASRIPGDHGIAWNPNSALKKPMDLATLKKTVIDPINPNFGRKGTKDNCMRATFAYELRRRGYDVRATLTSDAVSVDEQSTFGRYLAMNKPGDFVKKAQQGASLDSILGVKNIAKVSDAVRGSKVVGDTPIPVGASASMFKASRETAASILSTLSKLPNGARGEVGISSGFTGHSMAWEVIKGKATIIDAQSGKIYDTPRKLAAMTYGVAEAGYTRLDNKEMNLDFLERWMTNA